ncbi:hypothetical protein A5N15_00095 [Rothia kristinae]|uniref:23S rRNA (Uracil(747)-C(5))-methyltransferase RlmC n=1 Tax=Rothia kristinae TaxID=37923 RepID=A0A657IW57_9MICC|nr:hypothetical protein A5N15_00095 [Rothia kristinae]
MHCDYYDAGLCRSCTRMNEPYPAQLADKQERLRQLLAPHRPEAWLEPVPSPESGFRNKAKMVVSGTVERPLLGILDRDGARHRSHRLRPVPAAAAGRRCPPCAGSSASWG